MLFRSHKKSTNHRTLRIQPIDEWVERRRKRECDEHVTRMDVERLVKIPRDNIPVGKRSPGSPKRRWSDLIID